MNELLRENLIVSTITFHGGDNSISYPWGNYFYLDNTLSPDNLPFEEVAVELKKAAGLEYPGLSTVAPYKYGTMTNTVYACYGAYEDFVYAGSWE